MGGLLVRGLLYRLHNIIAHAIIIAIITGQWHVAVGTSIAVNVLNVVLYYHFHFWVERLEKRIVKHLKGEHEVFVVVDVYPDTEPHSWLASDEIFDLERYWDGIQWTMYEKDALTWEMYETALGVADAVTMTAEVKGRVCVKRARLETTIEMLGECG